MSINERPMNHDTSDYWTKSGPAFEEELDVILSSESGMEVNSRAEKRQNLVGLAFSGGGIRSATFNLGVLEGLKELDLAEENRLLVDGVGRRLHRRVVERESQTALRLSRAKGGLVGVDPPSATLLELPRATTRLFQRRHVDDVDGVDPK